MRTDSRSMLRRRSNQAIPALLLTFLLTGLWPMVPVSAQSTSATHYCLGERATIVHVGYDATVMGTAGDDVILVNGGWNHIYAGDGDDKLCIIGHFNITYADDGDDALIVTGLHNTLYGGDDDDELTVDDLSNIVDGGDGENRCNGDPC